MTKLPWENDTQSKNIGWFLPRPKPDHYKGGMPLHCESWLIQLGKSLLGNNSPNILQVFAGMNKSGLTVDILPEVEPDIVCDAHELSAHVTGQFDIIIADPPYSTEEAKQLYGTPKLNYMKWTAECTKLLRAGGLLMVYHKYVMPNPSPGLYKVLKRVFIGTRTYHLARVVVVFQKGEVDDET